MRSWCGIISFFVKFDVLNHILLHIDSTTGLNQSEPGLAGFYWFWSGFFGIWMFLGSVLRSGSRNQKKTGTELERTAKNRFRRSQFGLFRNENR